MKSRIRACALALALGASFAAVAANPIAHAGGGQRGVMNVAAVWATTWGSEVCTLTLQQSGTQVTGQYVTTGAPPGAVDGTMEGNVLTGTWTDAGGSIGGMRLSFSEDGRSFVGTWGSGGSYDDGGDWNGRR